MRKKSNYTAALTDTRLSPRLEAFVMRVAAVPITQDRKVCAVFSGAAPISYRGAELHPSQVKSPLPY